MDRNVRYEVLQGEEEDIPAEPVVLAMVVPPPAYEENTNEASSNQDPQYTTKLPSYKEATTLPTYDEAERSKRAEAEEQDQDDRGQEGHDQFSGMMIGTDGMFLCTFILSFLFNWIGFLFSLCISQTIAGRYGALSGLGLSIVKWVAIMKHNQWAEGFAEADSWLWWLLIVCGFMMFVKGAVQYARVKHSWNQVMSRLTMRRYSLP